MDTRYGLQEHTLYRLIREWKEYGKIIIAYDFDDTVYDYHGRGDTFNRVIQLLQDCRDYAHFVVFTACDESQYDKIRNHLILNDIPFDKINENVDTVNFKGRKVYYNIFLDDRAGLDSTMTTLQIALNVIKERKRREDE
jgi:hypothetical protein